MFGLIVNYFFVIWFFEYGIFLFYLVVVWFINGVVYDFFDCVLFSDCLVVVVNYWVELYKCIFVFIG